MSEQRAPSAATTEESPAPESGVVDPEAALAETEDRLRRALADLDNLRKRYHRELAREREAERRRVAAAWLPVVDNLERALDHTVSLDPGRLEPDCESVLEGVRAVRVLATGVLAGLGYPRFDDTGKRFDPHRDEAVSAVAGDPPGMVLETVRPGYGTDDDILRPAGVVVSRGPG